MTERLQIASFLGESRLRIHRLGGGLLGFGRGPAKFSNDGRQFLEQVIHLSIGGIFAEAKPHSAHGVLGRQTHGNEHMAGSHGARALQRAQLKSRPETAKCKEYNGLGLVSLLFLLPFNMI